MIRTLLLMFALAAAPALADDEEPEPIDKTAVQAFMRELWNELAGGEPAKFKEAFDLDAFVEYAGNSVPIAAIYKANLKKGLRRGMKDKIGPLVDQLARDWANAWLDICEPRKDELGRWHIEVATFDYATRRLNFSTWLLIEKNGELRWIDFQEMVNGTWMKTRMSGVLAPMLMLKVSPESVHLFRQLGEAGAAARWKEVKRVYGRLAPLLQRHRAILPTARMAATQLEDKPWMKTLRTRWVDSLGVDSSLLFGDIDHYMVLGDHKAALAAAQALLEKKGGHPLMHYQVSVIAHRMGDFDVARDSAYAAAAGAPDFPPARLMVVAALAGKRDHVAAVREAVFLRKKWPAYGKKVNWIDLKLFHEMPYSREFLKAFGYALKRMPPKKKPPEKEPQDPPRDPPKDPPKDDAPEDPAKDSK